MNQGKFVGVDASGTNIEVSVRPTGERWTKYRPEKMGSRKSRVGWNASDPISLFWKHTDVSNWQWRECSRQSAFPSRSFLCATFAISRARSAKLAAEITSRQTFLRNLQNSYNRSHIRFAAKSFSNFMICAPGVLNS